ncbi:hypothetical protein K5549_021697, partial [Capra hircus]
EGSFQDRRELVPSRRIWGGGRTAPAPPSRSMKKTRKNKQKPCGNGDGGNTSEAFQPPWKKREAFKSRMENKDSRRIKIMAFTRQEQLFQLSAKKNVDVILHKYANCKKLQGNVGDKEYVVNKVVTGIKEYFSVILGTQLLYAKILLAHPDVPAAPHLLRLFVRTGAILAHTPLDEKSLALLLGCWHDFQKYLAKDAMSLFTASGYKVASAENHHKAL